MKLSSTSTSTAENTGTDYNIIYKLSLRAKQALVTVSDMDGNVRDSAAFIPIK